MDLNKPINLSFSLKGFDIANAKLPLAVALVSILGALIFGYFSFGLYSNYAVHAASKSQYESLTQQKLALEQDHAKILKGHGSTIEDLAKSANSKSELAATLSGLVSKNGMKLSKLNSNDASPSTGGKDAAIELEADGQFQAIKKFLEQARLVMLASDVTHLKITKSKESRLLHLSLGVKFTKPPKLEVTKQKVAFKINGQDYFYDTFSQWQVIHTGFVQAPDPVNVEKPTEMGAPNPSAEQKRSDPFQAPPQPFASKDLGGSMDPANSQVVTKKANVMYLSGILYSASAKFCIVVMPSGESKVFAEGEKINAKITVNRISDEDVTFAGKKTSQYKVGQELPL